MNIGELAVSKIASLNPAMFTPLIDQQQQSDPSRFNLHPCMVPVCHPQLPLPSAYHLTKLDRIYSPQMQNAISL